MASLRSITTPPSSSPPMELPLTAGTKIFARMGALGSTSLTPTSSQSAEPSNLVMASDTQLPDHPNTTFDFLCLPPEIRNSIYELLLIKQIPIPICSPLRKHAVNKELSSKSFAMLLRLNKQINIEASTIFYSRNQFIMGNGSYGSTKIPNLHGLNVFRQRVPKPFLAHITHVIVQINCRKTYVVDDLPRHGGFFAEDPNRTDLGTSADASALLSISRTLVRHFTGLEVLTYERSRGPALYTSPTDPTSERLPDNQARAALEKMIQALVKQGKLQQTKLEEIRIFNDSFVDVEGAAKKVLSEKWKQTGNTWKLMEN